MLLCSGISFIYHPLKGIFLFPDKFLTPFIFMKQSDCPMKHCGNRYTIVLQKNKINPVITDTGLYRMVHKQQ